MSRPKTDKERQQERRERLREQGYKPLTLWVTDREREALRRLLDKLRK